MLESPRDAALGAALAEAARSGDDATTRLMSLLSLAERGDARILELLNPLLHEGSAGDLSWGLLTLGLYARADRTVGGKVGRIIDDLESNAPDAAHVARDLARGARSRLGPLTRRGPEHLTGVHAGFVESSSLHGVIDLFVE